MQNPQAFDIDSPPRQAPTKPFRSDSSCFSPLADRRGLAPTCAHCGGGSRGGTFTDMDSGYPIGQVTGTVQFSCGCDGKKVFSIAAENIGQWNLFKQLEPGVFRVKKKTQAEQLRENV